MTHQEKLATIINNLYKFKVELISKRYKYPVEIKIKDIYIHLGKGQVYENGAFFTFVAYPPSNCSDDGYSRVGRLLLTTDNIQIFLKPVVQFGTYVEYETVEFECNCYMDDMVFKKTSPYTEQERIIIV